MKKIKINLTHTKSNLAKKYIEVQKKDMLIHTINKNFDIKYSLGKIEKELNPYKFIRCHKSFIVNLRYVENKL